MVNNTKKIELGGGVNPFGAPFLNVDKLDIPGVDIVCDLDKEALPFDDDSVDEVFSSHCLEHLKDSWPALLEICRVCREGARVEIRLPHWLHPQAMSRSHVCVISDFAVRVWDRDHEYWFPGKKRLALKGTCYVPELGLYEIMDKFPGWGEELIMRYIPGCCHEVRFMFTVEAHEPGVGEGKGRATMTPISG